MSAICLNCYISGIVQGVFFRRETYNQAKELGLTGFVKNLSDGRVQAIICGEKAKVNVMVNWLWQGPPAAKVSNVEIIEVQNDEYHFSSFEVR